MVGETPRCRMTADEFSRIENGQVAGEAILFMRSRPRNPDGTIGFSVVPETPEWTAWQAYFRSNGMRRQASFMRLRGTAGYMVPCRNPSDFDPSHRQYKEAAE